MTSIKTAFSLALACALSAAALPSLAQPATAYAQPKLPAVKIQAGPFAIQAEVAHTPRQRELGLMGRTAMAPHEGMIFVFEDAGIQCFWMKNTLLPLSTAFVKSDGKIVNIEDMAPMTERTHCSTEPVHYVLEMNQGWFKQKGLKAGMTLKSTLFKNAP